MKTLIDSLEYKPTNLKFGTSGLRALVTEMTDLECYINVIGFLSYIASIGELDSDSVVFVAGDLRSSTPRILEAVHKAISDSGYTPRFIGLIPTPALAYFAQENNSAGIMVTGSHIPADRNGIKFYKKSGEVLKSDEVGILESVASTRNAIYNTQYSDSVFDVLGNLKTSITLNKVHDQASVMYKKRYLDFFGSVLVGKKIVFYQHSAVGRDLLVEILEGMGASVETVGRSDVFVPIDTENVTKENLRYFKELANSRDDIYAIISTDGDSDRPFVIDKNGTFYRGDILGAITARWLDVEYCAYPVSSCDVLDIYLDEINIEHEHTKIGSPYVIDSMNAKMNKHSRIAGWEVNGGFLLGTDIVKNNKKLKRLPTRDAFLPIAVALVVAFDSSIDKIFSPLIKRHTQAGLLDNFDIKISGEIVKRFSNDSDITKEQLSKYFNPKDKFSQILNINYLDGIRIYFSNKEIVHIRPSGNAPQLRVYSVADSQRRADEIVRLCIAEPKGVLRKIESDIGSHKS